MVRQSGNTEVVERRVVEGGLLLIFRILCVKRGKMRASLSPESYARDIILSSRETHHVHVTKASHAAVRTTFLRLLLVLISFRYDQILD